MDHFHLCAFLSASEKSDSGYWALRVGEALSFMIHWNLSIMVAVGPAFCLVLQTASFWAGLVKLGQGAGTAMIEAAAFNSAHTIGRFHSYTVTDNLASLVPSLLSNFLVTWCMKNVMWPKAAEEPGNWNKATT